MLKALQNSYARRSPFYALQCFFAERPELIETPLMRNILPEGLKHNPLKVVCEIEFQGHIVDKLILTYLSVYNPQQTLINMSTAHKKERLELMLQDLRQNPKRIKQLFSISEPRHITSAARYDDLIPRVIDYVRQLVDTGVSAVRIIDIGCAPQTVSLGAPALEKLMCILKEQFSSIVFETIGTDAVVPADVLDNPTAGKQGIRYVRDFIDHSLFVREKFDIVIFNRVPLFNGITKNEHARDKGIRALFKMSRNGLFLFDPFTSDTMLVYVREKLTTAFLHADDDLLQRIVFRQNRLNVALATIFDCSNIENLDVAIRPTGIALEDFLQNIQSYLHIMVCLYMTPTSENQLKTWFVQGCVGPMPPLIACDQEKEIILNAKRFQMQWRAELQVLREKAIKKENDNEYPWLELSYTLGTKTSLRILSYILANPQKVKRFFLALMEYISTHQDMQVLQRLQSIYTMLQLS